MPIRHEWGNPEHTIMHIIYFGEWTWDDYYASVAQVFADIATEPHRVDVIADLRSSGLPKGGRVMAHGNATLRTRPSNYGVLVVITNPLIKATLDMFRLLNSDARKMMFPARSMEDAREIVERARQPR